MSEADASEMVDVLGDVAVYEYIDGGPPTLQELRLRYARQAAGSPDPTNDWLNWIVRLRTDGSAVGTVQGEVFRGPSGVHASVAWVIGRRFQGNGFASEAASALASWLEASGIEDLHASIHPEHVASMRVAARAGFIATADTLDGETVWRRRVARP